MSMSIKDAKWYLEQSLSNMASDEKIWGGYLLLRFSNILRNVVIKAGEMAQW